MQLAQTVNLQIAKTLKVPLEAIKNFNEEGVVNIVANTVNNNDNANGNSLFMYYPTFNPIDKYVEAVEKNEKLYEALLKEKEEKIALLEKMLGEKKK